MEKVRNTVSFSVKNFGPIFMDVQRYLDYDNAMMLQKKKDHNELGMSDENGRMIGQRERPYDIDTT